MSAEKIMIDWDFVLESLKWAKYDYEQKAQKYIETIKGYREKTFEPKIRQFNDTMNSIQQLKKILLATKEA